MACIDPTRRRWSEADSARSIRADLAARPRVESGECLPPGFGQLQQALAAIRSRGPPLEKLPLQEAPEDATQVACLDRELLAQLGRGGLLAVRELVEHASLGQGERAVEQPARDLFNGQQSVAARQSTWSCREIAGLTHRLVQKQ
jgi:hypothetical protein